MKNSEKETLRAFLKEKRKKISQERKAEAGHRILEELYPQLMEYTHVLSFASFGDEIDLWSLNALLCQEKRLLLPRIENDFLTIYHIHDLKELVPSKLGILEPNPKQSTLFNKEKIPCALIPALGFDIYHHRLGYGKGHFDRFLAELKTTITIGIGFKEQLIAEALPIEKHDIKLDRLILL